MNGERPHDRLLKAETNIAKPMLFGLAGALLLCATFVSWAATAPIEGAAVAAGKFVARGQNKQIQHFEGGIVAAILVKEGDRVRAGDMLLQLDTTAAEADFRRLSSELDAVLAREARLLAELQGAGAIDFPAELTSRASDELMSTLLEDQRREFEAAGRRRKNEAAILEQKIKAQEVEIEGYRAEYQAAVDQADVLAEEIAVLEGLVSKKLATHERLYQMRRTRAGLLGEQGKLKASIGRAEQGILENRQEIERIANDGLERAAKALIELRVQKATVVKDLVGTKDFLTRSAIRSTVDGVVVKFHVNTIGGVLQGGGAIADILPLPTDLVVEAHVDPADIDRIYPGQKAGVRIPALHIPYSPLIDSKVEYVSADTLIDEATGNPYYLARISAVQLPSDIDRERVYPGMQVEAFIVTEPRTFTEYVLDPLWKSFSRSLREE